MVKHKGTSELETDLDMQQQWQPDESQRRVIEVQGGYHLVLAPPGCGKTQILTERIRRAHDTGVDYGDMLCLTFTNRAARGMVERIKENINDRDVSRVYVGNVHRFCSKFLFENRIIASETSIIDDEDAISIIARYLDEDEYQVAGDYKRKREYDEIIFFSHFMYQMSHGEPKKLRLHPDCVNKNDVSAIRKLCEVQRMPFSAASMTDIYEHTDFYFEAIKSDGYDYGFKQVISQTLQKMRIAHSYDVYKRENKLMDFEDLLMVTYEALAHDDENKYKKYPWIQVDEVQDLNPMQIAIVYAVTMKGDCTVMFLGDEQQAIFSFMGAKMDTLDVLKQRCEGHLHHLDVNHRSPKYLLDIFNLYAAQVLHIDADFLPTTKNIVEPKGTELQILRSDTLETEYPDVANFVSNLYHTYSDETTAIIVNSNKDADDMSKTLRDKGLPHFKVSGVDLFSTPEVKLLLAHFNVVANENNFIAWSRLMKGLNVFQSNAAARNFMRQLLDRAILPTDFLLYEGTTYMQDFMSEYEQGEIVIFDTETTGLNVFEDDILQIAAVKTKQGQVVEGSEFTVFIATDREIPEKLGDIDNPIIEEMKHNKLYSHEEALRMFIDYVGDDVLLGHNANYDYNILDYNLQRYLPSVNLRQHSARYFDSLKLVRLLEPDLKEYKLKYLLSILHLEGENSHLADADVNATRSVVVHCYKKAREIVGSQREFLARKSVQSRFEILRSNYRDLYFHSMHMLYERDYKSSEPVLISEMKCIYQLLIRSERMMPVEKLDYIFRYLSDDILNQSAEPSLKEQLDNHIVEINTLKEADLCNSSTLLDRIFVTTVHKAKGLEFDNVVVFDAVEGRYPNFYSLNNPKQMAEDARKFYVAMSRAKKRLFISQSMMRLDYHRQPQPRQLTPFMTPLLKYFN
jgi:DNA helicase-2/ATP-dependent DNA helicase PcrA